MFLAPLPKYKTMIPLESTGVVCLCLAKPGFQFSKSSRQICVMRKPCLRNAWANTWKRVYDKSSFILVGNTKKHLLWQSQAQAMGVRYRLKWNEVKAAVTGTQTPYHCQIIWKRIFKTCWSSRNLRNNSTSCCPTHPATPANSNFANFSQNAIQQCEQ